jgi:hypothetical protein
MKRPQFAGFIPVVDGANQPGPLFRTRGWPPSVQVADVTDWISFAGCQTVNPITREPVGVDRISMVARSVYSDHEGRAILEIYPAFITSGHYRNVSELPADGAVLGYITEMPSPAFVEAALRMNR